jgi:hypothetical protein
MEGDPQLFGALPGPTDRFHLYVSPPKREADGRIVLTVYADNKRQPMVLECDQLRTDQMHTTLGFFIPLIVKATYVGTAMLRRHVWAVHNGLGLSGRSVRLTGAGKPRRTIVP